MNGASEQNFNPFNTLVSKEPVTQVVGVVISAHYPYLDVGWGDVDWV